MTEQERDLARKTFGIDDAVVVPYFGEVPPPLTSAPRQAFVWIGMNSITIYLASNILGGEGFVKLANRFAGGDVRAFFDQHWGRGSGELVVAIVGLGLAFWFVRFLYRRKIFLRL